MDIRYCLVLAETRRAAEKRGDDFGDNGLTRKLGRISDRILTVLAVSFAGMAVLGGLLSLVPGAA